MHSVTYIHIIQYKMLEPLDANIADIQELVPVSRPFPITVANNNPEVYVQTAARVLRETSENGEAWIKRCGRNNFSLEMSIFVAPKEYWKFPSPVKEIFGVAELCKPYSFILQFSPVLDANDIKFEVSCFDYDKLASIYDIFPSMLTEESPTIFRYVGRLPGPESRMGVYIPADIVVEALRQTLEEDSSVVDICGEKYHFR